MIVDDMDIVPGVRIAASEISFSFSRSSGPGGQNVNKVNTRVTLSFDVTASPGLSARHRQLLFSRLGSRINKQGVLRIAADSYRTQQANKDDVIRRFVQLLKQALHERRPRKKTKITRAAKERRLSAKKNRGQLKKLRGRKIPRSE